VNKNLLLLLISLVVLYGCVQRQYQNQQSVHTSAQAQKENDSQSIKYSIDRVTECSLGLRKEVPGFGRKTDPATLAATKVVDSQVLYAMETSPNKIELMASNSKITQAQKQALLTYISVNQICRELARSEFKSLPSFLLVYENYYGDIDIVYSKLISKEITIGEANREKSKLAARAKNEMAAAGDKLNNQYNAAINQENQARQAADMQRRAIAAQYLMNQQNINAAQQINNQNQMNNQLMNNKPITTNCNKYGNQVNCTSY
jgi:hypothetical protein